MSPRVVVLVCALLVTVPPAAGLALTQPDAYLVGYEAGRKTEVVEALDLLGLGVERELQGLQVLRVTGTSLRGIDDLLAIPGVVFAETDGRTRAAGAQWNGAQWDGAQWDGERGPDAASEWGHGVVRTGEAWTVEGGKGGANVCVVDSGVDADHPDLAPNAWSEDGVHGFNAITGGTDAHDDAGHGTHVAGIAAAVRGNGIGVAGVTQSRVMSAKVLDASGQGTVSDLAVGMTWCADHGADVALLALSVEGESQTVKRALDYLARHDVVIVASAGNNACSDCVSFPARDSRVLAVTAIGPDRHVASFSSTGPQVDLAAPGVDVRSTFDGGGYAGGSGTSQAAAWVAGAAALVREHRPDLSAGEVRDAIRQGAVDAGAPGRDAGYGAGILDVRGALEAAED